MKLPTADYVKRLQSSLNLLKQKPVSDWTALCGMMTQIAKLRMKMKMMTEYRPQPIFRINSNPGIINHLAKLFNIHRLITHKGYGFDWCILWYGNTEGSNIYEGYDLLVIGTPYHAEFLYKLVAFTMGLDFDEDAEMMVQLVSHNGYQFWFNTYKDEALRDIQFWMLESELEQAVGRARLLRNRCTVHLFSNFPLIQSNIINDFDYGQEATD